MLTVDQLIERLREFPGYYPVMVEVIVGGDLGTDVVDLESIRAEGHHSAFVTLIPDAADHFDTRALIDEGLAARETADSDTARSEPRHFLAPDGENEPTLWRRNPTRPEHPTALLRLCDLEPTARDRWPAIVAAVIAATD